MEVEIQLYFPLVHNPARGNTASTFPQKEKKGLTKKGHPKVSNKHTQMQEEEERKASHNTIVGKVAVKNFRSARGERKNINLRPKTHQNDKMGEQICARESKHPICLERRAESSCTEVRLKGPKCKAVPLTPEEVAHTDMEAEKASHLC